MNAMLWRKFKFISNRPIRLFLLLVIPIIYLWGIAKIFLLDSNAIVAYFPLSMTLFSVMFIDNVEDFLYCEPLFATSLSNKKIWSINLLTVVIPNYLYCVLLLAFFSCVIDLKEVSGYAIIQCVLGFFLAFSIIANATIWYCDISKFKQWLSFPFGIGQIIFAVLLVILRNVIIVNLLTNVISLLLIIVFSILVIILLQTISTETLLNNLQAIINAYDSKTIND